MNQPFTTASPINAVYNFTDVAEGTGVISLYLCRTTDSVGDDFILTSNSLKSADEARGSNRASAGSEANPTQDLDDDYDLTAFNSSRTIEGTATLNIPYVIGTSASSNTRTGYLIVKIRKWDGATETEIASVQSETVSQAAGTEEGVFLMQVDVPRTHFSRGETLRITMEVWTQVAGSGTTASLAYGTDPADRDFTWNSATFESTQSQINIPLQLDL
jgi:hypothetical protein